MCVVEQLEERNQADMMCVKFGAKIAASPSSPPTIEKSHRGATLRGKKWLILASQYVNI